MRTHFTCQSPAELQMLEARRLLAATVSFDSGGGILHVIGDDSDDQIEVTLQYGQDGAPPAFGRLVIVRDHDREIFADYFLDGQLNEVRVDGGFGNDSISISNNDVDVNTFVSGDQGEDSIEAYVAGRAIPSRIHGGEGDDMITLLAGREALEGYVALGEGGNDRINGSQLSDVIYGDNESTNALSIPGDDAIHGGAGNDVLYGGPGNDDLSGDEGDDFLDGGEQADILDGGAGNDQAVVDEFDKFMDIETILP